MLDFLVLFYFPFSILFFSYLLDNYRTVLITVLFIRTDRLSCINIRVIIIISGHVTKVYRSKVSWFLFPS